MMFLYPTVWLSVGLWPGGTGFRSNTFQINAQSLRGSSHGDKFPRSRQIPRPGLATRTKRRNGAQITIAGAFFLCPQSRVMAAVRGRPSGLPSSFSSVRQPAYSCHPNRLATVGVVLQMKRTSCMTITSLFRILASALHRPTPRAPHRFYPIPYPGQSNASSKAGAP